MKTPRRGISSRGAAIDYDEFSAAFPGAGQVLFGKTEADLFQFADPLMGRGLICIAPNHAVCSVFDQTSFVRTFGGYCLYTDSATGQIFIGVRRKREASRFRRLMREGGVTFSLRQELPASLKRGAKEAWSPNSGTGTSKPTP